MSGRHVEVEEWHHLFLTSALDMSGQLRVPAV